MTLMLLNYGLSWYLAVRFSFSVVALAGLAFLLAFHFLFLSATALLLIITVLIVQGHIYKYMVLMLVK
jgi:uncharacterized membrane protein